MSITSHEYSSSECNDGPSSSSSVVPWGKNSNSSGSSSRRSSNKKDKHRRERKVREKRNLGLRLRLRRRLLGLSGQLGLLFGQVHSALIYVTIGFMMASSTEVWTGKQTSTASSDVICLGSVNNINEKHEPNPEIPLSLSLSSLSSSSSFVMDPYDAIVQAVEVRRLRVYTYPLPSSFNTDFNMTTMPATNGNDRMLKAERRIHEMFRSPGIATDNPNAADFFFVPIYPASACAYHKQRTCKSWNERPDCHGCKQGYGLIRQSIEYLQTHHVFRRYFSDNNGGENHIFPVFYDYGICMETFLDDARRHVGKVPSAIQKSVLLSFLGDDSYGCYRSGQDIVLPPFVDDVSQAVDVVSQDTEATDHARLHSTTKPVSIVREEQPQLRQRQQEGAVDVSGSSSSRSSRVSSKYRILMHFRGNTHLHPSSPTTRTRLVQQYGNEPGSIVSDEKVDTVQLHSELIRSRFCLVPPGFAPWSYRMVEAIQFECIPVLFDDKNNNKNSNKDDLPFASIIDYDKMAVRVSSDDDDDSFSNLSNRLQAISHEAVAAKRAYIRRVKPLFSYYTKEFEYGLMSELYKRLRSRPPGSSVGSMKRTVTSDPASSTTTTFNFDVDLVYTWVNGTDPEWSTTRAEIQAKFTKGRPTGRGIEVNADSIANMRFRDREELRYSLRSIQKNAPWIRMVHIVVAGGQNISWANIQHPKLNIVRHEDIFPAKNVTLPTYNSFAIESFVDNIPGLSEHFVLMNDDFFIGRPVEKSSFFTFEGHPKVAFQDEWMTQSRVCRDDLKGSSANHTYLRAALNTYKLMDAAYGHEERRLVMHQAYPLTKSLYRKAKRLFRKEFASTARNHFRTGKDIIPHFLALYTGFQDGTSVKLRPAEYLTNSKVQFGDNFEGNEEMIRSFNQTDYDVFFINDHTSDEASEEDLDRLTRDLQSWMASMFPTPSQFEKKA
mmetsp:Transcript_14129/g.33989  ORF Transcript_14129/g.33989 Transcript_14129/m.33989 type:complete len:944 (-) Transcript_14129:208-3039(-)|eukprot:CAMPEP_0113447162 /NCGR_PEP_ID=MMETSP0014_2-20120614/4093_1 /TAXON_ID=2857 /ORGANISM="Nitzschia sp." /LENGTH=943 /DNA_ID=CAMNT_0000338303 /DNA_START=286 /DNA_END=3117 /DNA_ORIENTATION=- /assembly_acc=CAM_ASM_000159